MPLAASRHFPARARVAVVERLEGRTLCDSAGAPAGFLPVSADPGRHQLMVSGEVGPGIGDEDFFSLGRLRAGDGLSVSLSGADAGRGTLADPWIELYRGGADPQNPVWVTSNDDGSGHDALILRQSITVDDTYLVRAKAADPRWTGTYALAAWLETRGQTPAGGAGPGAVGESEPNGDAAVADDVSGAWRAARYVSSREGNIGAAPPGAADEPAYTLRAGDLITVQVDSVSTMDAAVSIIDDATATLLAVDRGDNIRGAGDTRDARVLAYRVVRSAVYRVRVGSNDRTVGAYRADVYLSRDDAAVVGRHVFYNNSRLDGRAAGPGPADDAAVATDKAALRPGAAATLANVTNFSAGINGVMVDVKGLAGELAETDFAFAASVPGRPGDWEAAPAPASMSRRAAAGVDGSDRITFTWPDGAIVDRWLRVTLKASEAAGVGGDDVFLFGNLAGETGDTPGVASVTAADVLRTRDGRGTVADAAGVSNGWFDFNRDGRVNAVDQAIARAHVSRSLPMFAAASEPPPAPGAMLAPPTPRRPRGASRRAWDEAAVGVFR